MSRNTYFDSINMLDNKKKHYFASCNTPNGFVSFFGDIFSPDKFETVYILKGGPGVGKSTLLKTVGKEAESRGMDVEYFHCSSSPTSLDGIIINDLKTALFDGTPPHCVEPTYPGVREIIINMGECWNTEKLKASRDKIIKLVGEKSRLYAKATNYLSAVESIKKEIASAAQSTVNHTKLSENVHRVYMRELSKCPSGNIETRITSAFCNIGRVRFDTFAKCSETNYFIKEARSTSYIYFEKLFELAKSKGIRMLVSYSPENPTHIDGLYFPDKSISFTILSQSTLANYDKFVKFYRIINMERFIDKEQLKSKRHSLKFGDKCIKELEKEAFSALALAGATHDSIEALYIPSTDYKCVTMLTNSLVKQIFDEK